MKLRDYKGQWIKQNEDKIMIVVIIVSFLIIIVDIVNHVQ